MYFKRHSDKVIARAPIASVCQFSSWFSFKQLPKQFLNPAVVSDNVCPRMARIVVRLLLPTRVAHLGSLGTILHQRTSTPATS